MFVLCLPSVHSLDINITEMEAGGYFRGEYTRASHFLNEISAIGKIELEEKYAFKGGFAVGKALTEWSINSFVNSAYSPFENIPLGVSVSYIYNGLPDYETHANSIIPFIFYNADRAGISLGCNFRFTRFFGEKAQFESILSLYGYFNFINKEKLLFGIGAGNFYDFYAYNLGAYSLNINTAFRLDSNWRIINDIEFRQSGGDGLTTTLYGIAFRTGAKYSW